MGLKLITAPTQLPVTLDELKRHLRIFHGDENDTLLSNLEAAVAYLDGYKGVLGSCIMSQVWELAYDAFPCGPIKIPLGPLISVDSVTYDDQNGAPNTVSSIDYYVDTYNWGGWVVPVSTFSWPTTLDAINVVRIRFTAGYATQALVPASLKQAIKLLAGHWNEHRESSIVASPIFSVPKTFDTLIAPHRRVVMT